VVESGQDQAAIVERDGLEAMTDDGGLAEIAVHPAAAEQVRPDDGKAIGPRIGHVRRETRGPQRRRWGHGADAVPARSELGAGAAARRTAHRRG
jgi:hypothetical protein